MRKARLFYTTWCSPRRAILSLALIGAFAAALVVWLGATPALAQSPTKPDPVSNLQAAVGDTEVMVSWTLPTTTGVCAHTRVELRLYEIGPNDPVVMGISLPKTTTSYVAVGLEPKTMYDAEVRTHSSTCSDEQANRYSIPVYQRFTTNEDSHENDPSTGQMMPPKRPTNLNVSQASGTVTISWNIATDSVTRCPVSYYALYMGNRTNLMADGFPVRKIDISGAETTVSASLLTSGNKYEVYVAGYSLTCGQYSPSVRMTYTH